MTGFLKALSEKRRFGMKPGLDAITRACALLQNPQREFKCVHIAGTNGKGAIAAILDSCLRSAGYRVGRYTSPHLVRLNERYFLDGRPVDDETLERIANEVTAKVAEIPDLTFFEALTAVAFRLYAESAVDYCVMECGLGGRLDATNVCTPAVSVIARIGLEHCDWLGDTVEKIAFEKAGIIKRAIPVVLGRNEESVQQVVRKRAEELGAPYHYAPDIASEDEIPDDFSLRGRFNRENAVTAIATLKVLLGRVTGGFGDVVWPCRFQRAGRFIVDGAHNPPAAMALVEALEGEGGKFNLIAGFCGDKDVRKVLRILAPRIRRGFAVQTNNPRSLSAEATAAFMRDEGIASEACVSLDEAISAARAIDGDTLICGSLFLAGEAIVKLGAYPWGGVRFDPSEQLKQQTTCIA